MTRHKPHLRRRGFTLVELIVAAIMLAILVTATYAAVGQVLRARDRSVARGQAHQRAELAADLIAADAEQALRDPDLANTKVAIAHSGASGAAANAPGHGQDGLLLFTHITRPVRPTSGQNEGSECESQYRLEPGPGSGQAFVLWRRQQPVPDDPFDGGGVATALVDGLVGLTFEANDGSNWTSTWDSDNDGFPHALRLTVVASDDGGHATATARRVVAFDRTPVPNTSTDTTTSTTGTSTGSSTP